MFTERSSFSHHNQSFLVQYYVLPLETEPHYLEKPLDYCLSLPEKKNGHSQLKKIKSKNSKILQSKNRQL